MVFQERQNCFPAPLTRLTKQIILQLLQNFPIFVGRDFLPISPQPHIKPVRGGIQEHDTERFSASAWQLTFNQRVCPLFRRNLAEPYDRCRHYQLAYRFLAQQCEASRQGKLKKAPSSSYGAQGYGVPESLEADWAFSEPGTDLPYYPLPPRTCTFPKSTPPLTGQN